MKLSKKRLFQFFKIVVSLSLLVVVFYWVDIPELIKNLKNVNLLLYVLALFLAFFRIFISAFRWQRLLLIKKIRKNFSILLKYYFIATFYNLFLPTALGGDAFRIYALAKDERDRKTAISSIVIERLLGFLSLCFLGFVGLLVGISEFQNQRILFILFFASFFLIIALLILLNKKIAQLFFLFFGKLPFQKFVQKIRNLHENFINYSDRKDILFENFLISLFYQLTGVLKIAILGYAVGIDISLVEYFIFVPIIWILIMIPVSVSGIGMREGAFVYLFMLAGVEKETALLLSLMEFSHTFITGIAGGFAQIVGKNNLK